MAFEHKPGDGTLYINDRKTKENSPDRTGFIFAHRDIKAGEKLNLAAWLKGSDPKKPFLSLRMSDMRGQEPATGGGGETAPDPGDLDEEIPFASPWGIW